MSERSAENDAIVQRVRALIEQIEGLERDEKDLASVPKAWILRQLGACVTPPTNGDGGAA